MVYLHGDASSIEQLGKFLLECAKQMLGTQPFHRHFRDFAKDWNEDLIDIAVGRPIPGRKKRHNKN